MFDDETHLQVGECQFDCSFPLPKQTERLQIEKPRALVERYISLLEEQHPRRIVELGIRRGGSTALINELCHPDTLVAIELTPEPVDALTRYIEAHDDAGAIRPHYGVDQGDRAVLSRVLDQDLQGADLDLVIDDASHLYAESRASFEMLYPRLRPGGLYVLEDWWWQHLVADLLASSTLSDSATAAFAERLEALGGGKPEPPMSQLVLELVVLCASSALMVAEIQINRHWAMLRRGDQPLDHRGFSLDALVVDHFQQL
jgi:predicted O-methyltransferase YrrM